MDGLLWMGSQILSGLLTQRNYLFNITFSTSKASVRRKEDKQAKQRKESRKTVLHLIEFAKVGPTITEYHGLTFYFLTPLPTQQPERQKTLPWPLPQ